MHHQFTPRDIARFWSYVEKQPNGCWMWTSSRWPNGYGFFSIRTNGKSMSTGAHRAAWMIVNGPIPDDLQVCHSCDALCEPGDRSYRKCVNPDHLWLGTNLENRRDSVAKGRQAKGDRHGMKLHPDSAARGFSNGAKTHPERIPLGSDRPMAKLTEAIVTEARFLYQQGATHDILAVRFGVGRQTIGKAIRGETWRHVPFESVTTSA